MLKEWLANTMSALNELFTPQRKKSCAVFGCGTGEKIIISSEIDSFVLYVAVDAISASNIARQLENFGKNVCSILSKQDMVQYHNSEYSGITADRFKTLFKLCERNVNVLVISADILTEKMPDFNEFKQSIIKLEKGKNVNLKTLITNLVSLGYKRVDRLETRAQFSLRGDILDIFSVSEDLPVRIELFDTEIESIKYFNADTYLSVRTINSIKICPFTNIFIDDKMAQKICSKISSATNDFKEDTNANNRLNEIIISVTDRISGGQRDVSLNWILPFVNTSSIYEYLPENSCIIFDEPKRIIEQIDLAYQEFYGRIKALIKSGEVTEKHREFLLNKKDVFVTPVAQLISFQRITNANNIFTVQEVFTINSTGIIKYSQNFNELTRDLKNWNENGFTVIMCVSDNQSAIRIKDNFDTAKIPVDIIATPSNIRKADFGRNYILLSNLETSATFLNEKIIIIGSSDLIARRVKIKINAKTDTIIMPKEGDYVVHSTHGIGKCLGIQKLTLSGYEKDYIVIEYKGADKLYLPTEQAEQIAKFVGSDKTPTLSKIGGADFEKIKERVKSGIKKMAVDLLKLYKAREESKGFKYSPYNSLLNEFERTFPYIETEDQLLAINDVYKDMESGVVMDRLICGDVGYGKTEIALRAAFKAILDGKQVALLAPTTILAEQHYNVCRSRMENFGVVVESLSRFKNTKEQKNTIERLKSGVVNIVCGTHRLLSNDVMFQNLGLLILDEEQKFGVSDKEKIKTFKNNVAVMTLSATPIPRTLHMSLIGIRDISTINTPPVDRLPVQTYVIEYSDALIIDAVNREIYRGGQVFLVYNRVETIYAFAQKIASLLPDVIIDVAHGQMKEAQLESAITKFYDGKTQVLICTTLIENGIDIPLANTLIVCNSDRFGLAQLYQLRGRIGRSNRLAYAYFTYESNKVLTENAYARLDAILEFTELGSGFKIALRDLEIRGAGNILGPEQHGHMEKVGYDMYCKLLNQTVQELKGETVKQFREVNINISMSAFIPIDYIESSEQRIRIYTNISLVKSLKQRNLVLKQIEDVYGKAPESVENLVYIGLIKNLAQSLDIKKIVIDNEITALYFYKNAKIFEDKLQSAMHDYRELCVLKFAELPIIEFDTNLTSVKQRVMVVIDFLLKSVKNQ